MAAKGEMYTSSFEKMEMIEALWVTCGYEDIMTTVEDVLWQVQKTMLVWPPLCHDSRTVFNVLH